MSILSAQARRGIKLINAKCVVPLCCVFSQLMLEAQNKRIDDLMERIRLQQEKLDKQNVRIRTLQSQVRKHCNYAVL